MTIKAILPVMLLAAGIGAAVPAFADALSTAEMDGGKLFARKCSACHQVTGKGIPGAFPALAGDKFVTTPKDEAIIKTVLMGRGGMPSFAANTDDATLAAILTYVRSSWGNKAPAVTAEGVAKVRKVTGSGASNVIGN